MKNVNSETVDTPREMETRTQMTFRQFQRAWNQIAPLPYREISLDDRMDAIVLWNQRRHVWNELRNAGWDLPELQRPKWMVLLLTLTVSSIAGMLAWSVHLWSALVAMVDLSWTAHKFTRPLAVFPPIACETVREAVLRSTPFRHEDCQAGLWPREDIAAKVRLILSESTGVPFAEIREDTRLTDLLCC